MPLNEKMTMDEIMRRWPQTIRAVIRNGMLCVGCPIAPFHTAPEAAREHGLDWTLLRAQLESAGASTASAGLSRAARRSASRGGIPRSDRHNR
ncbi:DUF1858 domain-containing protein [Mesorhizobium sp. RIZ17]|uniref:DUF1858 domain-containing protein n=1 Tax=Mesorhizobium sp. RIZ17 TaxID=3132743 RepID=UPI003DA9055E